uniref:Uncharacterized protein n=1 Tax=viral metagenome TaxID=1070528 RepID=A0A6C0HZ00_9ZZZZ
MRIVKQLLSFLFLAQLHNSFIIGYNSYNKINKLKMGCDYYIEQNLWIQYKDKSVNYINLCRERGYYYDIHYEDFDNGLLENYRDTSDSLWEKLKEYHLRPKTEPVVIYANSTFTNVEYSHKYSEMLHYKILNHDCKTWDDINEIVVVEERFERY